MPQHRHPLPTLTLVILFYLWLALPSVASAFSYDEIQERGEIIVGVYRDFPPFSYLRDGKPAGIDVDIAQAIAEQLGVRLRLLHLTADENVDDDLRNAVWKGHYLGGGVADVMLHIPYDRQLALRNDLVVLFAPYLKEQIVVARDRAKLGDDANLAVFRYEPIAVELDSLADLYLSGAFGGSIRGSLQHYLDVQSAGQALMEGRVAGLMAPRSQTEYSLRKARERFDIGIVPTPGLSKPNWLIGLAVKNTYRQLGYAVEDIIAGMMRNGEMARIFESHGISYLPPSLDYLSGAGQ